METTYLSANLHATLNPSVQPLPSNNIWISCTDNAFEFKENQVTLPGFVLETPGNEVTPEVIKAIQGAQEGGTEYAIHILGHSNCKAILGDQPSDTPTAGDLIRQNLSKQMGVLVSELARPGYGVSAVQYVVRIEPENFGGLDTQVQTVLRQDHSAFNDGPNSGFWAWVYESDGMFHLVYIASQRQP
ncbi:hypothetical protein BDN72DRAFT_862672 [Pluteus cervinus]|uniref:Uncharacterized protein n=1 Tax=Pluteus cervinus TaxID=181527 RepID=A0ACD3AB84_9AGAR|nr:hypothetical protein BDN72DRAFT_862672 [Pluteus cervinus]